MPRKQTTTLVGAGVQMTLSLFSEALGHLGRFDRRRWRVLINLAGWLGEGGASVVPKD